jgi:hypothetical protein
MRANVFTQGFSLFNGDDNSLGEESANSSYRIILKELTIWQGDAKTGGFYVFEAERLVTGDGREWIVVLPGKGYYAGPANMLDKIKGFPLNIRMIWDIDTSLTSDRKITSKEYKRLRKEVGLPNLGRPF